MFISSALVEGFHIFHAFFFKLDSLLLLLQLLLQLPFDELQLLVQLRMLLLLLL